jgi:iron complex outermembrane receptor protein
MLLAVYTAAGIPARALADSTTEVPTVLVSATVEPSPLGTLWSLDANDLASGRISSSDAATLIPGAEVEQAGGASGRPVLHGLADDRVRTLVDGVPVSAACPMHMNPSTSYIDAWNVSRMDALPGVTPASLGGDSIAGTVLVESSPPTFATADQARIQGGSVSSFYRSNGSNGGGALSAFMADRDLSVAYQASGERARDYQDGNGQTVLASRLESSNQQLALAARRGDDSYEMTVGYQDMPYEGFPNADMDLSSNRAAFLNLRYRGLFGWGNLSISGYYDSIHHWMDGNAPDRYPPSPVDITSMGVMPARERGQDFGYRVEADLVATANGVLRLGNELHAQTLDDRWPGAPVGMPFDFVNLNHATREQLGTFVEWERRWNSGWRTLLGARNDTVWMNTGPVQGYDGVDALASAFNASRRAQTDFNIDAVLMALYQPDAAQTYRFGIARKNRTPNLYERYAWGTNTMGMVTWFGDGNGYTGNLNLKPETAYTASASADWHDPAAQRWQLELTPYYTRIENYIGVEQLCGPSCSGEPASQLLFVNHTARLYGLDVSAAYALAHSDTLGSFRMTFAGGFVRGEDLSAGTNLYHMMPPNGTLALEQQLGAWQNRLEIQVVGRKDRVDALRLEPTTPGYTTLALRTAYVWRALRLDLAVTNLLDRQYSSPLGGSWQSALYPPGYAGATFHPLPAPGRSLDVGFTVQF